jgi:hypothetical protein
VTTIRVTIDETIQANRVENALRGLSYGLVLTPGSAAREQQASSRELLHRFAVPPVMTADEAKYLESAVVVLGGGESPTAKRAVPVRASSRTQRHLCDRRSHPVCVKDDERRRRLTTLFETQILTLEEFKQFCDDRRENVTRATEAGADEVGEPEKG